MPKIEFSEAEKASIVRKIQLYFKEELEQSIGRFDAEFVLDFFGEEIGPYFYNRALYEAQAVLESRIESLQDAIYELEKPTELAR